VFPSTFYSAQLLAVLLLFNAMHRPAEIEATSGFQSSKLLQGQSDPSTPEESHVVPIIEETAPQDMPPLQSDTISNRGRPAMARQPNANQDKDMQAAATSSDERPRGHEMRILHGEESTRPSVDDSRIRVNESC
jgi:hypothetical protein